MAIAAKGSRHDVLKIRFVVNHQTVRSAHGTPSAPREPTCGESACGSSRRAAQEGRTDQSATLLERGAGCALLVVWTNCEPRKDMKMDMVEAFTVREEEMDAAASGYAVP
jgi:hypothetical protein